MPDDRFFKIQFKRDNKILQLFKRDTPFSRTRLSSSPNKEIDMSSRQDITESRVTRASCLPETEHANAVVAALDKVLQTPTLPNRVAACAAVQAYLVATEHLWRSSTQNASR